MCFGGVIYVRSLFLLTFTIVSIVPSKESVINLENWTFPEENKLEGILGIHFIKFPSEFNKTIEHFPVSLSVPDWKLFLPVNATQKMRREIGRCAEDRGLSRTNTVLYTTRIDFLSHAICPFGLFPCLFLLFSVHPVLFGHNNCFHFPHLNVWFSSAMSSVTDKLKEGGRQITAGGSAGKRSSVFLVFTLLDSVSRENWGFKN